MRVPRPVEVAPGYSLPVRTHGQRAELRAGSAHGQRAELRAGSAHGQRAELRGGSRRRPGRDVSAERLLAVNALLRVAAAASGQLFAFAVAARLGRSAGVGASLVAALASTYFVTELAGAPFAGALADRVGLRRVLRYAPAFGVGSAVVATLSQLTLHSGGALAGVLWLARLNEGLSAACAVPTTLALLAVETDLQPERRTRVMGLFEMTSLGGMLGGYVLAGIAWDLMGTKAFALLIPWYVSAWLLLRAPETTGPSVTAGAGRAFSAVKAMLLERSHLAFAGAWLAVNGVVGVWMQQAPYLFTLPAGVSSQRLVGGFSGRESALIFFVWGLVFLAGLGIWSLIGSRIPRRAGLAVALLGMLGVTSLLALVNHGASRILLLPAGACIMVESGFTVLAFAHLADLSTSATRSRAASLGVYSFLLGSGQLAGNALAAPFVAWGLMDGVLMLTGLLACVALIGVWGMREPAASAP
jgi:Major Facilitator Superfamily